MTETEKLVRENTEKIVAALEQRGDLWNIYGCDDGAGPYISLHNPLNEEDYRCISLHDDGNCGEDLSKYHWQFWSTPNNVWLDSALDSDTEAEEVLHFLSECLDEEARVIANR